MKYNDNCVLLVVLLDVAVALVAASNGVVTMERKRDSQLDELLADDYLLLAARNMSRRIRNEQKRTFQATVTAAPPLILTEHPLQAEQRELLQNELLLPAFKNMSRWYKNEKRVFPETPAPPVALTPHPLLAEERELLEEDDLLPTDFRFELSRDKRAVAGSGDLDTEAVATVTLTESFSVAMAIEFRRRAEVAAQLRRLFLDFEVAVDIVTVSSILNDDGNAKFNFSVTFTGATDRRGVAYALERLWRSQRLLGGYQAVKSPTVCNSNDVVVNAICLLCPASRPCTADGVCLPFATASSTNAAEFGLGEADIRLARRDDVISQRMEIPGGMPFYNSRVNALYVGDNGGVSLDRPYNPISLDTMTAAIRSYLCIYCDDFDNRGGDVWYQTYPSGRTWAANMLDRVTSEVRAHTKFTRFKASWACVVTWSDIPEFRSYLSVLTTRNSFQMILVTDGQRTFMLFYYINIEASLFFRENGVHGYARRDPVNDVYEMLYSRRSRRSQQANFDKPNLVGVRGNTGLRGKWIFNIGDITIPNYGAMCVDWYFENRPLRNTFRNRAALLSVNSFCPCQRNVFFWSAAFLPTRGFTGQARFCSEMQAWFGVDTIECCYDFAGRFIRRYPEAGGYQRYSSVFDPVRHKRQDEDPKDWCCRRSNLCHLYQDVRPLSSCWWRRPIVIFIFNVGDPHFTNLDNKTFTFNGIGEYRLIELEPADKSFTFKLQCRTSQAVSNSGQKVRASVFSAFAAEQKSDTLGTGRIHVGLNKDKTKMAIYFDDIDVTEEFYNDPNFIKRLPHLTASRTNDTNIMFAFTKTGITMVVRLLSGALSQAIIIPETYKSMTKGLLGNYNGDPNDDFTSPDGTTYSADSTDRQLFPFGKSWAVQDQSSSVLHYAPEELTTTFTDNSFVPLYNDEISVADRAAATVVCGEGNEQCIYDYAVTKNAAFSKASTEQLQEAAATNTLLSNRAPSLTGTTQLNVEVGKPSNFTFIGSDEDSDPVSYITVDSPASGFTFSSEQGTGEYTPPNTNPVKISIAAKDTKDAESSVLDVQIRLCRGCGDNGECDYDTPETEVNSSTEALFQIVSCTCNTGWTGRDCTDDKDGCDGDPCGTGRTCTDIPAAEEATINLAYNCSTCLPGYDEPVPGGKCENIDECAVDNSSCPANSTCEDTLGSFTCTCNSGFRQNSNGTCDDIDECVEHLSQCEHTCTNTDGSYTCSCYAGFNLTVDGKSCVVADVPATCLPTCNTNTEICADNGTGVAVCHCKAGYEKKAGAATCTDIDECSLSLCAQKCNNSLGSYTCSCYAGFILAGDSLDCLRCSFPRYGDNCSSTCECEGRASACDPVRGCVCNAGWTGSNCATDIDECTDDPNICGSNGKCDNTDGSYSCSCNDGYVLNGTECVDLNECEVDSNTTICPSNSVCDNVLGSYMCTCVTGYGKVGSTCTDIDECATSQAMCEHDCVNKIGSYNCYCKSGYTLNDDRRTCAKDPTSPCDSLTNTVCGHYCQVVNNQAVCRCNRGYNLAADNVTCLDIDECADSTLNLCEEAASCTNTPGSYTCGCPVGQKLENDGRNCADCDSNHWGTNCTNECACSSLGSQSCDKIKGCVCRSGWTGTQCDLDLDECSSQNCPSNSDCVNTPGSFKCTCRTGYRKSADGTTCNQINECDSSNDNVCDHNCHDTPGSYYCTCRTGFILEGQGTCVDIDECTKGHDCQHICRNTAGSFTCQCRDGFQFADTARKTCIPTAGAATCSKSCNTTNGGCLDAATDTCFCNSGYTLNNDGFTCDDINECTTNNRCSGGCTNTAGSFSCSCDAGFQLAADKTTCEACPPGKYGVNCANNCACDSSNSLSCNATDGTCTCRAGWRGNTCTEDVLECTNDPNICGTNGQCNEKPGTYTCTCVAGYIRSNDACTACTSTTWGANCANTCGCDFSKTESCNSTNGRCTCKTGWTGGTCANNVDECADRVSPVCTGSHETCSDTQGSFICGCTSGYQRSANNTACIDTNECLSSTLNTCTYQCDNNDGNFSCSCPPGYLGSNNDCQPNFESYIIIVTLDANRAIVISNPLSGAYKKLQEDIGLAIDILIQPVVGVAHLKTLVKSLSTGSVVAPSELRVDKSKTDNDLGLLAKALERIAEVRSLAVDGSNTAVTNLTYKDIPILKVHTVCDVYKIVRAFSNDEYCELDPNGTPVAKKVSEPGDNVPLIVGLSVAAFFILFLLLLFLLYVCCYRRRSRRTPSEDRDNTAFRSAFVGHVPTKSTFGATRYMMYSPHTLSDAASQASEDSSGRRERRGRKYGTNDFNDLPQWTSDRSAGFSYHTQGPSTRHEASSNFSWEHLFNRLGPFEVPRPAVRSTPSKFHDSLA